MKPRQHSQCLSPLSHMETLINWCIVSTHLFVAAVSLSLLMNLPDSVRDGCTGGTAETRAPSQINTPVLDGKNMGDGRDRRPRLRLEGRKQEGGSCAGGRGRVMRKTLNCHRDERKWCERHRATARRALTLQDY